MVQTELRNSCHISDLCIINNLRSLQSTSLNTDHVLTSFCIQSWQIIILGMTGLEYGMWGMVELHESMNLETDLWQILNQKQ